jgi:N-sulfoglucosamine sulfohydrolase
MKAPSLITLLAALAFSATTDERPNFILVTGDEMDFQLGCYGDTVTTTASMDRQAREGIRFVCGYVTQASRNSSRSSMLTGLNPHQNGQIGLAHLG